MSAVILTKNKAEFTYIERQLSTLHSFKIQESTNVPGLELWLLYMLSKHSSH